MSASSPRALRLRKRNILKKIACECNEMSRLMFIEERHLNAENRESMSQELQTIRSRYDEMLLKHFELIQTFDNFESESSKNIKLESFICSVASRREFHFERYNHLHTEYCQIWFLGTGSWACLLELSVLDGYIDKNFEKCGYKNELFDED